MRSSCYCAALRVPRGARPSGGLRGFSTDAAPARQRFSGSGGSAGARGGGRGGPRGGGRGGGRGGRGGRGGNKYGQYSKMRPRVYRDPESGLLEGGRLNIRFVSPNPNSGLVPLDMRDEICREHLKDPTGKWSLQSIAERTGLPVRKVQAVIKLRQVELEYEKKSGQVLDQTLDEEARALFGEKRVFRGTEADEEKKARLKELIFAPYKWIAEGEEAPEQLHVNDSKTSYRAAGFFKPWKEPRKYGNEEVVKTDQKSKFVFIKASEKLPAQK
mmetsp:Transcript_18619/g.34496  ORF Transcript_18619/g.34496 Transcript_18619/m.34496 type:complete len:272 (-) Transcript_18619:1963-2778(-)|eukprot:CAMPEP_0184545174 /NCGR_PEP_ID=MMETSP0199_2-20130426/4118_1 /TAXON_ID=1112570 /ORGANISM="Thraustochytrium sp., Strain LLF1b" /LENGTH=271 /DNA_ID=CAMNT_0026939441 /DNA_START=107 /DNA_END=922 /DNA_ORIENTATION=+